MTELQIQHRLAQIRVGLAVGQQIARTTQQFGLFLVLFQPTGHLAVSPAIGQYPNRSPFGATIRRSIRVDGHQHVGPLLARHVRTAHHRNKVIPVTRHHRFEHRIGIQQRTQTMRDGNGDVFLFQAVWPDSARILSTMACIDRHHYPIARTGGHPAATWGNAGCRT
ncbi:hypothetical protein D3C80_1484240 [compost metagenome]